MPVTAEALRLQARLDTQVQAITDDQTRVLVAAWVAAWAEVSGDLSDTLVDMLADGGKVTRARMLRSLRLRAVLGQIADRLEDLAAQAAVTITSDLAQVVADAAQVQGDILTAQLPNLPGFGELFDRLVQPVSDRALDAIVRRSTEQITALTRPLSGSAYAAVRRELIRAVAAGGGPRDAAARMVRRTEGRFNGGLSRALVISRTEILDAHRAAAAQAQAEHADVLTGWVWLAHLDTRTCPACLARHGTLHDADEDGPEGHQQCRCARMPKVKPWAELGFDVEEPADVVPDAQAWFDQLSQAQQIELLGRARWDLLTAGEISWADLATRRSTDGWRDSWTITPLKDLLQRGGGSGSRLVS